MTVNINKINCKKLQNEDFTNAYLNAGLRCDDPMEQDNLAPFEKVSDEIKNPEALNRYNFRGKHVFCHACGVARHYKGLTVKIENGMEALIGQCCAESFFGKDAYNLLERNLAVRESYAFYKAHLVPLDNCIKHTKINVSSSENLCKELDDALDLFTNIIGNENYNLLKKEVSRNDGHLRANFYRQKILGQLSGIEFLLKTKRLTGYYVAHLNNQCNQAQTLLNSVPKNDSELKKLWILVTTDCRKSADDLLKIILEGCNFFSQENIKLMCKWLTEHNADQDMILKIKDDVPSRFEIPKNDWMQEFRKITKSNLAVDR